MQVEPPGPNRKVGLWMAQGARRGGGPSQLGRGRGRSGKTHRQYRGDYDEDDDMDGDDWDKEDTSSSLSEFVHPRHLLVETPKPKSNNSSASASSRQSRGALRKAARRMRPKKAEPPAQKAPQNSLGDLLEMPNWEHPSPFRQNQKRASPRGDASKGSKGRLGQLLDGGDDEEDSDDDGRETSYLQPKIQGSSKPSARSCASKSSNSSNSSRSKSKKGSAASASSLASKSIALHLENSPESDDESTGVELFRGGGKKSTFSDDDDGSISSASVEFFKPKPSKQEMAQSLLRSFDQELRMEAEKSKRQPQRASHAIAAAEVDQKPQHKTHDPVKPIAPKSPPREEEKEKPIQTFSPPKRQPQAMIIPQVDDDYDNEDSPIETFIAPRPDDDHEMPIETFSAPKREITRNSPTHRAPQMAPSTRATPRHASTGAIVNTLPASPSRSRSASGVTNIFNSSLKFEDLELNGSIEFGDIEPFVAPSGSDDEDDRSISVHSCSDSVASVDMLSDQEKEDLEEKMIRMAMEASLSDSGSMLGLSGNFAVIDIGDEDEEVERMAEIELEKEMLDLAIQRSLDDSKTSGLTSTTCPITSEGSGSSGGSGSTAQSHRRVGSSGKSRTSSANSASGNSPGKRSGPSSRAVPNGSVSSNFSPSGEEAPRRIMRPCPTPRSGGHGRVPGEKVSRRSSGGHGGPGEKASRRSSASQGSSGEKASRRSSASHGSVGEKSARRQPRTSRPVQDI